MHKIIRTTKTIIKPNSPQISSHRKPPQKLTSDCNCLLVIPELASPGRKQPPALTHLSVPNKIVPNRTQLYSIDCAYPDPNTNRERDHIKKSPEMSNFENITDTPFFDGVPRKMLQ